MAATGTACPGRASSSELSAVCTSSPGAPGCARTTASPTCSCISCVTGMLTMSSPTCRDQARLQHPGRRLLEVILKPQVVLGIRRPLARRQLRAQ